MKSTVSEGDLCLVVTDWVRTKLQETDPVSRMDEVTDLPKKVNNM